MNAKRIIYWMIISFMLTGCAANAVIGNTSEQTVIMEKPTGIFIPDSSDKELFEDALFHLSNNRKEPNYNEARARLEDLVFQFPKSKWIAAAQALLANLDRISALQVQLKQEKQKVQGDHVKLAKEMEGLRDNTRQTEEKYSAEIIRLQQENEQLKKDIQRLKNLEIQLEKREKMLR